MTISLKLTDSIQSIEKKVNAAIADSINSTLQNSASVLLSDIKLLIPSWIQAQPEIKAISSQELIGAFGTTISSETIINAIINSIVSSSSVSIKKYNKALKGGGFELNIQPDNFLNLLGLREGHTYYSDGDLHWLDWMLTRGNETIIVGYQYDPKTGFGRTRLGHMIKDGSFRVPPQYSGTANNNFVTRALLGSDQEKQITALFKKALGA